MSVEPIQEFFDNEEVFITGASGLIGKSVVEKLLRSCPKIKKIYLLLRGKHGVSASERLEKIKESVIFDRIRAEGNGDFLNKIVGVTGDISQIGLALSTVDLDLLKNVSIIFHIAATVRFDEPLKNAIFQNVRGTREMLRIAENLKNLKKFVHCSTTYSNPSRISVDEKLYDTYTDWENCIKMAEKFDQETLNALMTKLLDNFPNTYTFSKHVAEHLVNSYRHRVPVVIFRPAIVINSVREPFIGWYDNLTGAMALFATIGLGLLRVLNSHSTTMLDFVPLDLTTIFLITITWKDYNLPPLRHDEDVRIYHLCSSRYHSLQLEKMVSHYIEEIEKRAYEKTVWYPRVAFTANNFFYMLQVYLLHIIPGFFLDGLIKLTGNTPFVLRIHRKVLAAQDVLKFVMQKNYDFANDRMDLIMDEAKDSMEFRLDHRNFPMDEYMRRTVTGVRRFILKDSNDTIISSNFRLKMLKWLDRAVRIIFYYWVVKKSLNVLSEHMQIFFY